MTAPGSAVIRALAILVTESHAEATPDALDHWRSTALQARLEFDRLRAEVDALRAALGCCERCRHYTPVEEIA